VTHFYSTYGLSLESDVPLPGIPESLLPSPLPPLRLWAKERPHWAEEALRLPQKTLLSRPSEAADPAVVLTEYGQKEFYRLAYSDGAEFLIDAAATKLWARYSPELCLEDMTVYLLGPVLGFVLRRRGVTSLHASAISLQGRAVALCGPAGAGKSTTAGAFALRGIPVLCEDIAALKELEGALHVLPGYPRVCLWPDSPVSRMGSSDALPRLTPTWEKRYLPLDGTQAQFEEMSRPLHAIYFLMPRSKDESAPRVVEISRREAVLELVQNTYMNWLLTKEQRAAEFDALARLTQGVVMRRAMPHEDPARLGALCHLIEKDLAQTGASPSPARVPVPR
jgi:hypothetical protein